MSSMSSPQWLMIVAIVATIWLLLAPRQYAAGPIFLIMSVGTVMAVPVDLGVQDSLRGFLGSNFSEAGNVEEKEGVWIENGSGTDLEMSYSSYLASCASFFSTTALVFKSQV